MSSSTSEYKKKVEEKRKNIGKDNRVITIQKKYFLLCGGLWMASTLTHFLDRYSLRYKKCPACKSGLDRFLICDDSVRRN